MRFHINMKTKYFLHLKAFKIHIKIAKNRRFKLNFRTPHQYTHNWHKKRRLLQKSICNPSVKYEKIKSKLYTQMDWGLFRSEVSLLTSYTTPRGTYVSVALWFNYISLRKIRDMIGFKGMDNFWVWSICLKSMLVLFQSYI